MVKFTASVNKSGEKLLIYIPERFQKLFKKGDYIEIILPHGKKFVAKFNYNITIRKRFLAGIDLHSNINIRVQKIESLDRPKDMFFNNKIDILSFIPEETDKGYEVIVTNFKKDKQEWLRCWYAHKRGSGRQIELRRYIQIETVGCLLGQYQAEGKKDLNDKYPKYKTEFKNKSISEHNDFLDYLKEFGINKEQMIFTIISNARNKKKAEELRRKFENIHNVKLSMYISKDTKGIGISSIIGNTILFQLIINAMNTVRKGLAQNISSENKRNLAYSFLAKLLNGDGSLEYRRRYVNNFDCRIKISDGNKEYREDYKKILLNLGFSAYICGIDVRSYCSKEKLDFLRRINAFKNTKNEKKLNYLLGVI